MEQTKFSLKVKEDRFTTAVIKKTIWGILRQRGKSSLSFEQPILNTRSGKRFTTGPGQDFFPRTVSPAARIQQRICLKGQQAYASRHGWSSRY